VEIPEFPWKMERVEACRLSSADLLDWRHHVRPEVLSEDYTFLKDQRMQHSHRPTGMVWPEGEHYH
jgi:hypothetical protein